MDFLPKDYEVPTVETGYMKLEQGENRFRILSSAIVGWEGWIEEENDDKKIRKPQRFRNDEKPKDLRRFDNQKVNHFWAFVVWNYQLDKIQILEITQKRIQREIKSYCDDDDFGHPNNYDLVITREGEKFDTRYTTKAKPPKPIDENIKTIYESLNINLEALYDGNNPFEEKKDENEDEVMKENNPYHHN